MTLKFYPNGLGGALSDSLDTAKPLITSGNVWYVLSGVGVDGASPHGQNREAPLATVGQAVANAADDDIIVFLTGHSETLTAAQVVAKRLTFIGEGLANGKPSVSFRVNSAVAVCFNVTATNVELRSLYFPESVQSCTASKINCNAARFRLRGCYFDCGFNDQNAQVGLLVGCDQARIESSTFIATGASATTQPLTAIASGGAINDLEITDTVVSSGTSGFSNYWAIDLSGGTALRTKITGLSLLLGADIRMGSAATGYLNVQTSTGGVRGDWS